MHSDPPFPAAVWTLHDQSPAYDGNIASGNTLTTMRAPIFQLSQRLLLTIAGLLVAASILANEMIIPRGSSWKYHNLGHDLGGTGWQELGYDDSGWAGPLPGPLGDNL